MDTKISVVTMNTDSLSVLCLLLPDLTFTPAPSTSSFTTVEVGHC
jgi:hypothetical protein